MGGPKSQELAFLELVIEFSNSILGRAELEGINVRGRAKLFTTSG